MVGWPAWGKDYRHGTLVIWPPDPLRAAVNRLRQTHDPNSQAISEAHITLTQPFLHQPSESDWSRLAEIASEETPFEISYGPLNAFFPAPIIYFEIQPADRLLAIRQLFHQTGLFNLELPYTEGFVPHMTITESLSGTTADKALQTRLSQEVTGGTFSCSSVAYIRPDDDFHFRLTRRLPLGNPV